MPLIGQPSFQSIGRELAARPIPWKFRAPAASLLGFPGTGESGSRLALRISERRGRDSAGLIWHSASVREGRFATGLVTRTLE